MISSYFILLDEMILFSNKIIDLSVNIVFAELQSKDLRYTFKRL